MAFPKRNWTRKWPRRRTSKIPATRIPKSIARVRTDWVGVYNVTSTGGDGTACKYLVAPFLPVTLAGEPGNPQCFSTFGLDVMTSQRLSDLYQDDCKIVKMVGDIWMRPVYQTADACNPQALAALQAHWDNHFI